MTHGGGKTILESLNGPFPAFFSFLYGHTNNKNYKKSCKIMAIWFLVLGFELMASWTRASSHCYYTQGPYFAAVGSFKRIIVLVIVWQIYMMIYIVILFSAWIVGPVMIGYFSVLVDQARSKFSASLDTRFGSV